MRLASDRLQILKVPIYIKKKDSSLHRWRLLCLYFLQLFIIDKRTRRSHTHTDPVFKLCILGTQLVHRLTSFLLQAKFFPFSNKWLLLHCGECHRRGEWLTTVWGY